VAALARRVEQGAAQLNYAPPYGYLPGLLEALHIPASSQISVFSKTSIQAMRIDPANPRILYFNDSVAVGYVHNGFLELAAQDPADGSIHYYALQQRPDEKLTLRRDCVSCHHSSALQVRTAVARSDGIVSSEADMTPATPFPRLFGGWYVTGAEVPAGHRGNAVVQNGASHAIAPALDKNLALRPSSDIVALLVFTHQMRVMNLLARPVNVNELAAALTFADAAPLPGPIRGDSGFAEEFSAWGRRDRKGRSLRDFDLRRTLMRYPCSYMIESDPFQSLPPSTKNAVYHRMEELLRTPGSFSESARKTAIETLREIAARP
jgi:hypothetical protein